MSTGAKMRVYEIAREVGIPNKDLLAKIRALGLEVNNHMSSIDADDVVRIKRSLEKERQAAQSTETHQLSGGAVLRRRSNKPDGDTPTPPPDSARAPITTAPAAVPVVRRRVEAPPPVETIERAPEPPPAPRVVTPRAAPTPPPPVEEKRPVVVAPPPVEEKRAPAPPPVVEP